METAKVDIRKLQLLNDRISQCIDALNQVRLSVHGLQHSTGLEASTQGLAQDPRLAMQQFSPWASGIAHSSPGIGGQGFLAQGIPFGGQPLGVFGGMPFAGQTPFVNPQLGQPFFPQLGLQGLSHTSPEVEAYNRPTWADPYLAAKVAQTFPYARFATPPVVAIY